MIKSAFMLGAGIGMIGGMFLVKMCPKAEQMVDDIKSKVKSGPKNCNCGCEGQPDEQN